MSRDPEPDRRAPTRANPQRQRDRPDRRGSRASPRSARGPGRARERRIVPPRPLTHSCNPTRRCVAETNRPHAQEMVLVAHILAHLACKTMHPDAMHIQGSPVQPCDERESNHDPRSSRVSALRACVVMVVLGIFARAALTRLLCAVHRLTAQSIQLCPRLIVFLALEWLSAYSAALASTRRSCAERSPFRPPNL